jgi:hypothetical protein
MKAFVMSCLGLTFLLSSAFSDSSALKAASLVVANLWFVGGWIVSSIERGDR